MKHMNNKANALSIAMLIGASVAVLLSAFSSFSEKCEKLPPQILRLHILANSDGKSDQDLKYELRDDLIVYTSQIFSDVSSVEQAKSIASEHIDEIENRANSFLKERGFTYQATAEVTNMYFTTRKYGNMVVPAGKYDAIRIVIGEGGGKNWWCMMYPPLCLPACTETASEPFFSEQLSREIEDGSGIQVKFAVYETLSKLFV